MSTYCTECNNSHSIKMLCSNKRETLDLRKSCDYCGERHSYLNTFFDKDTVHFSECLDRIEQSNIEHMCENKAKSMVYMCNHKSCSLCTLKIFPEHHVITHEDVESVECIKLIHFTHHCPYYCYYCYVFGDMDSKSRLHAHKSDECTVVDEINKRFIDNYR